EPIGREGRGPEEWLQPDAVHPMPGDSTLLVDLGNGRLAVIGPDLTFARTRPIALGTPQPGRLGGLQFLLPRAVDAQGRAYFQGRALSMDGGAPPDSVPVLRTGLGRDAASADTVALVKPQDLEIRTSGGANERSVSARPRPMSPQDDWAAGRDGSLALVRSDGYYVQVLHPDGRVSTGPRVAYEPQRVGDAEVDRYTEAAANGLGVGVTVENGRMQMQFSRGGMRGGPQRRSREGFPDVLPPFVPGATWVAPDGRIWVKRYTRVGQPSLFDVFDGEGRRVAEVSFPGEVRIVGFGDGVVYTATTDDMGLQWLSRYRVR
ncbi:MAG: hypothetical protein D6701_04090, partial [Gemmatimonadetes bacterium]